jgi:predicted nucleic acid-binding Zn ribbon protein
MAKICKVCGVRMDHDEEVCSSCTEFFKWKYGPEYKDRMALFLKTLEKFNLTKLLEGKK